MSQIERAVEVLRAGGIVAFPTETVYGLGADATSAAAVARIFAAKGRPATNPLIVHVADEAAARRFAADWLESAGRLARRFWPGPLTLVVPKAGSIPDIVTAGRGTVALRAPDHPVAQELLRAFGGGIAAPSANRSTRVSPTTAQHVRDELGDAVEVILDGGACRVGIESTVLDLTGDRPVILRPGHVAREQIQAEVGPVEMFAGAVGVGTAAASPGQHEVHYAPRAAAYRFERAERGKVLEWCARHRDESWAVLCLGEWPGLPGEPRHKVVRMPADAEEYARRLYALLHELDAVGIQYVWIEYPPDEPRWVAVRDRLRRATKRA